MGRNKQGKGRQSAVKFNKRRRDDDQQGGQAATKQKYANGEGSFGEIHPGGAPHPPP